MVKPEDTDTYCYRPEEVQAMLERCRSNPSLLWLADVIVALAYTGMRISELASLGTSNVDLARNMLMLRDESRTKRAKKPDAKTTKSKRFRCFPIHAELRAVLERVLSGSSRARVFTALRGGILRPDNVRWVLIKQVIEPLEKKFPSHEDEIGFKDGRLHSLRHFFCSFCAHSQVPEQVVMRWLGHRDSKMVRRYYHLHDEEAQRQMLKLKSLGDSGALERLPNFSSEDPEVTG
jgi:integrase